MDAEPNGFHREDYYLAQIAMCARAMSHPNPKKLKLKDFMFTFKKKKENDDEWDEDEVPKDPKKRADHSKAVWLGATVGAFKKGLVRKPPKAKTEPRKLKKRGKR
jgi:hypothetical protein